MGVACIPIPPLPSCIRTLAIWVTFQSEVMFILSTTAEEPCDLGRQEVCDVSVPVFWIYTLFV